MASSMIHLAITQCLIPEIGCGDDFRLRLGAILPDGAIQGNAHLKKQVGENRITYDLEFFRRRYRAQMETDGLYLGYYLHLIQDIFYRNFLYTQRHWDPTPPGNVERLHRDYGILNGYVAQKFHLCPEMLRSIPIEREPIAELAVFDDEGLIREVRQQFADAPEGEPFFFTREMADMYIADAVALCRRELQGLQAGTGLDSLDWSWTGHVLPAP